MSKYASAIVFALVPGFLVFVLLAALGMDDVLAGLIGGALAGAGMDVCINGRDRQDSACGGKCCNHNCRQSRDCPVRDGQGKRNG